MKLHKLLEEIHILSPSERQYVEGVFSRYSAGEISKFEVEKAVRQLKFDTADPISPEEAEKFGEDLKNISGDSEELINKIDVIYAGLGKVLSPTNSPGEGQATTAPEASPRKPNSGDTIPNSAR